MSTDTAEEQVKSNAEQIAHKVVESVGMLHVEGFVETLKRQLLIFRTRHPYTTETCQTCRDTDHHVARGEAFKEAAQMSLEKSGHEFQKGRDEAAKRLRKLGHELFERVDAERVIHQGFEQSTAHTCFLMSMEEEPT